MKLSEAVLIREITGEQPVALLDDVMSELDAGRQDYILNHIEGWQVFITCCEPSSLLRLCDGKRFLCVVDVWKKQHKCKTEYDSKKRGHGIVSAFGTGYGCYAG